MAQDVTREREDIDATVAGETVPRRFLTTIQDHESSVALRWREGDAWREWTFRDYADRVARVAAGLRGLGVGPGDRVVLMMANRPEFHVADLATLMVGGTPVSIYNSSSPEQVRYLTDHCRAKVAVVGNLGFLERFLKVRGDLPALEHLVVIDDPDGLAPDDVTRWADLAAAEPLDLAEAAQVAGPEDLATIIYTSGTTGAPKGVMLSHYNICWTVESLRRRTPREDLAGMRLVSYLPMAHVAERMTSHYQQAIAGYEVTTCPEAGQIATYLREVRPQLFFGVPRVFEKVYAGVKGALAADADKAQKFDEAVAAALPLVRKQLQEPLTDEERQTLEFLDAVAFSTVRQLIGLDAVEYAISGAAPIPVDVLEWFRAIGVPLSEIYGMSENSGPMTWDAVEVRPGTVGRALPGVEVRLGEDGEVCCQGGNVFVGYLDDPERTAETLVDGWLHSGDIGELDDDGYLRIVDRKKELIITAGGKNVSPANLEAALKSIPLVGQAAAIGDQRPFVAALLVLDPDVAPAWARGRGIEAASLDELARHPEVREEVGRGVEEVMGQFNNAERVKKWVLLGEEWLPDSDVLTPTSKLKRRGVHGRYAAEIESLYAS